MELGKRARGDSVLDLAAPAYIFSLSIFKCRSYELEFWPMRYRYLAPMEPFEG